MTSQNDLPNAPDPFDEEESIKLPTRLPGLVSAAADILRVVVALSLPVVAYAGAMVIMSKGFGVRGWSDFAPFGAGFMLVGVFFGGLLIGRCRQHVWLFAVVAGGVVGMNIGGLLYSAFKDSLLGWALLGGLVGAALSFVAASVTRRRPAER